MRLALALFMLSLGGHYLAAQTPPLPETFLTTNCHDCHSAVNAEGGLDLQSLKRSVDDTTVGNKWVRVLERVQRGEMPPPDDNVVPPGQSQRFIEQLGSWIHAQQQSAAAQFGRVRARKLTNSQLERSLHDLLGIDIPLADEMPDEPRTDGFTTVADGQSISHFQMEQHLRVVDLALDEAFRRALTPADDQSIELPAEKLVRTKPKQRTREPELIEGQAVTWSSGLIFYGRLPATTAKVDGWYRFTVQASALKSPSDRGVWCTIRSGRAVSSSPLLAWVGSFEATDRPKQVTVEAWLKQGDMIEIRPGDLTLKSAKFSGGQVGSGEGGPQNVPGVAIDSILMQRFHRGVDDDQVRKLLFAEHRVNTNRDPAKGTIQVDDARKDIARLMSHFARRAFRRPVAWGDLVPYVRMAHAKLDESEDCIAALRTGYRALLCSSRFLYLQEQPGLLDDHAIAARLSYLLRGTTPDWDLMKVASSGKLRDRDSILEQTDRMLAGESGERFVRDFAAQWLDLSLIDFTEPDRKLYPGFDIIVQQSMLDETHRYLLEMLRQDLSVSHLIDSDFTFLNSRLSRYYGIQGADTDLLQRVSLLPKHHRGGLLTHGSIMKVTANGTTTSPVLRGVWVSERLLGQEIPPPPENVPAIEPDVRGAKSIREMLAKHTSDASCASCHRDIDPPGFALENFDPSGRWRDSYATKNKGKKNNAPPIDAGFTMPDGQVFHDLNSFKELVLARQDRLASNLVDKLITYGTGASVRFADREAVKQIVQSTADGGYGFRSLIDATVTSKLFLSK